MTWHKYACHKEVEAAQIAKATVLENGDLFILPMQGNPFVLCAAFNARHKPEAEGYIVQYADGYMSYSPQKAFEEGYTRVSA